MSSVTAWAGDGFLTTIRTDDGKVITVDEPADAGGTDQGPTPRRLLAAAVASCISITLRMYAGRKEWDVTGLEVTTELVETGKGEPTLVRTRIKLPGGLDDDQRERLRVIAGKCPVSAILTGEVEDEITLE